MKTITKERLAEMLNGNVYFNEMTNEQERLAKDNNLLVVLFGQYEVSNTRGGVLLLLLRGAVRGDAVMLDGGRAILILEGETFSDDEDLSLSHKSECIQILPLSEDYDNEDNPRIIRVESGPQDEDLDWIIDTKIPHEKFVIKNYGVPYYKGIVIDLDEVQPINQ